MQDPSTRAAVQPFKRVGQYDLYGVIGQGSFASVYRGEHRGMRRVVAVKQIVRAKLNRKLQENLEAEISILQSIEHPNVMRLHEVQTTERHVYLMLEFCPGGDLMHVIKKHGAQSEAQTRVYLVQLAHGLQHLRQRNLIHRDLKPQNLLLSNHHPHGELKIGDFGFARYMQQQDLAETLCGSPLYMAPEILRYHKYDAKADLWSVGAIMFELITSRTPYTGDNHIQLLKNIESKAPRFPTHVSQACNALLFALLQRDPMQRLCFESFFNHEFLARAPLRPPEESVTPPAPNGTTPPARDDPQAGISSRGATLSTATPSGHLAHIPHETGAAFGESPSAGAPTACQSATPVAQPAPVAMPSQPETPPGPYAQACPAAPHAAGLPMVPPNAVQAASQQQMQQMHASAQQLQLMHAQQQQQIQQQQIQQMHQLQLQLQQTAVYHQAQHTAAYHDHQHQVAAYQQQMQLPREPLPNLSLPPAAMPAMPASGVHASGAAQSAQQLLPLGCGPQLAPAAAEQQQQLGFAPSQSAASPMASPSAAAAIAPSTIVRPSPTRSTAAAAPSAAAAAPTADHASPQAMDPMEASPSLAPVEGLFDMPSLQGCPGSPGHPVVLRWLPSPPTAALMPSPPTSNDLRPSPSPVATATIPALALAATEGGGGSSSGCDSSHGVAQHAPAATSSSGSAHHAGHQPSGSLAAGGGAAGRGSSDSEPRGSSQLRERISDNSSAQHSPISQASPPMIGQAVPPTGAVAAPPLCLLPPSSAITHTTFSPPGVGRGIHAGTATFAAPAPGCASIVPHAAAPPVCGMQGQLLSHGTPMLQQQPPAHGGFGAGFYPRPSQLPGTASALSAHWPPAGLGSTAPLGVVATAATQGLLSSGGGHAGPPVGWTAPALTGALSAPFPGALQPTALPPNTALAPAAAAAPATCQLISISTAPAAAGSRGFHWQMAASPLGLASTAGTPSASAPSAIPPLPPALLPVPPATMPQPLAPRQVVSVPVTTSGSPPAPGAPPVPLQSLGADTQHTASRPASALAAASSAYPSAMPSPSASQADPHAAAGALGGVGRRTTPPCRDSSLGGSDSDYVLVSAPGDGSTSPCCERESAGGVGSVGGVPQPPALAFAPYAAPSAAEFAVSAEDSPDPAAEEEAAYLQGLLDLANLLARGGAIADLATLSAEGMAHGEPLTAVEALALHVKALDLMSHGISVAERVAATRNQTPDALLPAAAEAISQAEALRARGAGLLRSAEGVRAALAAQQREAHTATGRTAGDSGAFVAGGGSPGGGSGAFVMGGGPGGAGSGLGGPGGAGSGLFVMGGCAGGGGDFTMGEAGAGGAGGAGSDVDPMSVCVEEVLYRQALSMGREAAVDELLGQYEASATLYIRAKLTLEQLALEPMVGDADRQVLQKYGAGFAWRLAALRNKQQAPASMLQHGGATSGSHPGLARTAPLLPESSAQQEQEQQQQTRTMAATCSPDGMLCEGSNQPAPALPIPPASPQMLSGAGPPADSNPVFVPID